eukprot:m.160364 g.160364  ORF g.160364 m.160364 type:complete len:371 (-) comp11935_c0_seq1:339-1451(-)
MMKTFHYVQYVAIVGATTIITTQSVHGATLNTPVHGATLNTPVLSSSKKSIDMYLNFPSRVTDFFLGHNTQHWANTTVDISGVTGTVYQCCNGFLLGADGRQTYLSQHGNGTYGNNSWGQAAFVAAGKRVIVNIDPTTSATVTAADVCLTTLARKEAYANELIAIASHENIQGFTLDWEDATGNDVGCFNKLWGYVSSAIAPHGLTVSVSVDNSNHQGPMDDNSTLPWSTEWDWQGYVPWAATLVNMGTYPGSWSQGLSYPAHTHLLPTPCPAYPSKLCGLEGQVLDMLSHGVKPNGQLSPGLMPNPCVPNGTMTTNGWTQDALTHFLNLLDAKGVSSVTLWFADALQLYDDSFTCPWFMPTLLTWAQGP